MGDLAGADIVVDPAELELDPASAAELEAASNIVKRNMEILREFASREPAGKPRRVVLRFGVSPVAVLGEERVEGVELVRNESSSTEGVRAQATGERETLRASSCFAVSVGVPCPGLPFDEGSGTMPNEEGRVRDESGSRCPASTAPAGSSGPDRRHRHEQEGRDRDGRGVVEGCGGRAHWRDGGLRRRGRGSIGRARRRGSHLLGLGGDRRRRALCRRAAGSPCVKLTSWDDPLAAARGPK